MQQITTLATATNEFLRQFWSALYPPFIDDTGKSTSKTLANASPAQRDAKMLKMINYLRLTREKTLIIYNAAPHAGVEVKTLETVRVQ
jgi:transcription initiation factor TFIIH subunit 1